MMTLLEATYKLGRPLAVSHDDLVDLLDAIDAANLAINLENVAALRRCPCGCGTGKHQVRQ